LTSLDLGYNQLTGLPEAVTRLAALSSLTVAGNQLTALPEAVTRLAALTSLDLSRNQLTALPEAVGRLAALTSLDLAGNQLTALPEAVTRLAALSSLNLAGNQLGDLSLLVRLPHLESLNVSGAMTTGSFRELWEKPSLQRVFFEPGRLAGIPSELLSEDSYSDNCLPRLRAYFANLDAGAVAITDVKMMLLGNGRIGKTKIARRLAGEDYGQDDEPSTHGVQVKAVALSMPAPNPDARLRIWDFGGQDIYHGTHALFLKSRAIFPVVWTPAAERAKTHVDPHGFTHRNQPLGFWLAYVRQLGGEHSPVVVIQSQADRREDEADVKDWVEEGALAAFAPRPDALAYSAKTDRRRGTLNDALVDSVAALRHRDGEIFIPASWHWVQQRLEDLFRLDQQKPPAAREHRLVSLGAYRKLCQTAREHVGPVDADVLLGYLHDTGTVFYGEGLFDDHLILDQQWALDAVYAVFDRAQGAYADIRDNNGHFRASLLGRRVWAAHGPGEQALFLSFMQQCGICFEWRAADEQHGVEAEYIAPDLLPRENAPAVDVMLHKWGTRADAEGKRRYPFLPHGLMRTLMSKVGARAGIYADYWRDGFTFYDGKTKSNAKVWQVFDRREDGEEGWSGEIRVATRDGDAGALLAQVLKVVDEESARFGARAEADESLDEEPAKERRRERAPSVDAERNTADVLSRIKFRPEPRAEPKRYVSYARADDRSPDGPERELVVDLLCETASARGIAIKRDRSDLKSGESITRFMRDIGRGDLIFVVLSDKYWRSAYCMFELWEIWRNCRLDADELRERTRVFAHPSARLSDPEEIDELLAYWREKEQRLADKARDSLRLSQEEADQRFKIADILNFLARIRGAIRDTVRPSTAEEYVAWALEGLPS
ncbi:MAG: COR domain-containing protein, partial [Hyphomicrobiaceae bacterium]